MCFKKPKPDPAIAAEQEKQAAEVAAKKEEETRVAEEARAEEVERKQEEVATEKRLAAAQKEKTERQTKGVSAASAARTFRRSGSRGGRSLLTSLGGGSGYFSRFK